MLVTGGSGGLALPLARWLCERGAEHIVLLSRTQVDAALLPERVTSMICDVTDAARVSEVTQATRERWGRVGAIFHLAGVLSDGTLEAQDDVAFTRALAPKIAGVSQLEAACPDASLFVQFSSLSAIVGTPGQASYAAANAYLDAWCEAPHGGSQRRVSINWGPWGERGMFARMQRGHASASALSLEEGLGFLGAVLSSPANRVLLLPPDVSAQLLEQRFSAQGSQPRRRAAPGYLLALIERAAPDERAVVLELGVMKIAAQALGLADVTALGRDQDLMALGLDSLGATSIANQVGAALAMTLLAKHMMTVPTVLGIAQAIMRQRPELFAASEDLETGLL
jgi:hypothetical protein